MNVCRRKENVDPNTARVLNQYVQVAKQEALRQAAAKEEANKKANSKILCRSKFRLI